MLAPSAPGQSCRIINDRVFGHVRGHVGGSRPARRRRAAERGAVGGAGGADRPRPGHAPPVAGSGREMRWSASVSVGGAGSGPATARAGHRRACARAAGTLRSPPPPRVVSRCVHPKRVRHFADARLPTRPYVRKSWDGWCGTPGRAEKLAETRAGGRRAVAGGRPPDRHVPGVRDAGAGHGGAGPPALPTPVAGGPTAPSCFGWSLGQWSFSTAVTVVFLKAFTGASEKSPI
jgi:hypothetical protein